MYNVDADHAHTSQSRRLETSRLRGWVARRRWVAWCGAVRGVIRISRLQESEESDSYLDDHMDKIRDQDETGLAARWRVAYY